MIIAAFREGQTRAYTKSAYQFDKGQTLIVTGINMPETFDAHMANSKEGGLAYSCKGSHEGVSIPDALFVNGDYIYVWIYKTGADSEEIVNENNENAVEEPAVESGTETESEIESETESEVTSEIESDSNAQEIGETVYEIIIPIIKRPVNLPSVETNSVL